MTRHLIQTAVAAGLSGFNGLSLDTYWRTGDYELIAVDVKGQWLFRWTSVTADALRWSDQRSSL
jgi:hypothetical protein